MYELENAKAARHRKIVNAIMWVVLLVLFILLVLLLRLLLLRLLRLRRAAPRGRALAPAAARRENGNQLQKSTFHTRFSFP